MSPALPPLQHTAARVAAATWVGFFAFGAPMALLSAVPPVSKPWLIVALVGFGVWVAVFARIALTRGLVPPLMVSAVLITVVIVAFAGYLIPLRRIDESSSWTACVGSLCVVTLPMAWPARAAIPAGSLVIAAWLASFPIAGLPAGGADNTAILVLQLLSAVVVMGVVRRASATSDAALVAVAEARRAAAVAEARRVDVSAQLRLLHDTALTTLTLVGTGAIDRSAGLAARAGADLAVLDRITAEQTAEEHHLVRLDDALAAAVREAPPALDVRPALAACTVPAHVAEAFAGSVGEALRNVDRHAGVSTVTLRLTAADGRVRVEVADHGRGFDPAACADHRYGVRGSIVARMADAGGRAEVDTAPGAGTRWTLEWP